MPIFSIHAGCTRADGRPRVFSYLDRVYRELGRVSTGRVHEHLETFEAEIEPRFKMDRRRAAQIFNLLARLWLVLVAAVTARGVIFFVPGTWEAAVEMVFFLGAEVVIAMQFWPSLLLAGIAGKLDCAARARCAVFRLDRLADPGRSWTCWFRCFIFPKRNRWLRRDEQQAIEALVDAATEEGIIEQDEARLIEQVVEFGDKRVRDVMTPRPDVVAIPASATLEELRKLVVETKFSRLPVYEKSLDDIVGIAIARDMLEVPDRDAAHRTVRELMRPALFVPETKFGSELLKEMQRKNQQMAIVIDEYGLMAGIVTIEDLVEEIVGEIGEEDRRPAPDVIREAGGTMVLRGSVPLDKIARAFWRAAGRAAQHSNATTIAGLLNGVAGHVPRTGEVVEFDGLRFEVLEANQRKVLRVRARKLAAGVASSALL